jgi:hypothetical protein
LASWLTIIATMSSRWPTRPVVAACPAATEGGCRWEPFGWTDGPLRGGGVSYAASLVQQLSRPNSLSIVNDFTDLLQRLMSTQFKDSGPVVKNSHAYAYNNGSQRTSHTRGGNGHSYAGEVFVPATPEAFGYDTDGNLTSDGRWTYTSDGGKPAGGDEAGCCLAFRGAAALDL